MRRLWAGTMLAASVLLAGSQASAPGATPSSSGSPECAVPAQAHADPPPGCVVYDPEQAMALNDRHHQRAPVSDEARAAGAEVVADVRSAFDAPRDAGAMWTDDEVRAVLESAGLDAAHIIVRGGTRWIRFGAYAGDGSGGCVFGSASDEGVTVEFGGNVLDGGCLAQDGH